MGLRRRRDAGAAVKRAPLPKVDSTGVHQIEPGKWYALDSPETTECCDCGLVHSTEYQIYKGRLMFRTRVNRRATNAARKRVGITVQRKS